MGVLYLCKKCGNTHTEYMCKVKDFCNRRLDDGTTCTEKVSNFGVVTKKDEKPEAAEKEAQEWRICNKCGAPEPTITTSSNGPCGEKKCDGTLLNKKDMNDYLSGQAILILDGFGFDGDYSKREDAIKKINAGLARYKDEAKDEPQTIDETLNERGARYGKFDGHAEIAQELKRVIWKSSDLLDDSKHEALEMIAHKIARILNGDPNYDDSWRDIAGYATLIVKQISGEGV